MIGAMPASASNGCARLICGSLWILLDNFMTSLDEWYAAQREHLDMGLWLDLALRVARVDAMISAEYFSSAEGALPGLYDIIRQHDLPDWRVFIQLMESSLILGSTGNLNRAM